MHACTHIHMKVCLLDFIMNKIIADDFAPDKVSMIQA